jgi:hypothetical protein
MIIKNKDADRIRRIRCSIRSGLLPFHPSAPIVSTTGPRR